tara:strand:+ start:1665 stop:1790 length:126 start_codon:yes stop_codon:yes gene_type:complete
MPFKGKTNIRTAKSGITNLSKQGTQRPQTIPKPQTYKKGGR